MEKQLQLNFGNSRKKYYNIIKEYNGDSYTGMKIGNSHEWIYNNGLWYETKISPDKWNIQFTCVKQRSHNAPINTGAEILSGFHWFILADQQVYKIDENHYDTNLYGVKFKMGYKKPNWQNWSYKYPQQQSYKEKLIALLETYLNELKKT